MTNAILIVISIPVWIAGVWHLTQGLIGTFHPRVKYEEHLLAMASLPTSSALFYFAAHLCGLV